ncbi:MAG: acetate/propionate family kinase [Acidimicrobiia bacterium]
MRILVVNTGSSSLKLRVLDGERIDADLELERWEGEDDLDALGAFVADVGTVEAVGHRVVHGGSELTAPARVTPQVEAQILALTSLAPLHQPRAVAGMRALRRLLPEPTQVACFDTTFHTTLLPAAATYALPSSWRERWGLRRFGFHGLSHAWAVRRAPEVAGRPRAADRVISCHLGAGASLCAARHGRSVDTTMGYTPLEGLVMGTRSGSVDPGLVVWLIEHGGLDAHEVGHGLEHDAGLAGLSGTDGDLRDVLAARRDGDADAALAVDVYVHRLRREIAAMAAALDGVDVVAFTGGMGEHSAELRAEAVAGLGFLGLALDADANAATTGDGDISGPGAAARAVVVTAREDREIAHQVEAALSTA